MITKLKNPKTVNYYEMKSRVLSDTFTWTHNGWNPNSHPGFFGHTIIGRPQKDGHRYPEIISDHAEFVHNVVLDILEYNDIVLNCIFRINFNLCYPQGSPKLSPWHVDHDFPHNNLLVYLTDAGGRTFVGNGFHDPKEDDAITFDGLQEHRIETPIDKFRVSLVVTYM